MSVLPDLSHVSLHQKELIASLKKRLEEIKGAPPSIENQVHQLQLYGEIENARKILTEVQAVRRRRNISDQ